jgi:hypothetical protein
MPANAGEFKPQTAPLRKQCEEKPTLPPTNAGKFKHRMRRKILRLYNFGALARLRCVSPADAGEFKPQTAPLRKQCEKKPTLPPTNAGKFKHRMRRKILRLYNFGALARLRCVSPINAGEFKPQTAPLRKQCEKKPTLPPTNAGKFKHRMRRKILRLYNFGALVRHRSTRAGFVLN